MGKVILTGIGVGEHAIWPDTLPPFPLIAGATETAPAVTIRTNMEAGPAKVRMRTTSGCYGMGCQMYMTAAQLDTFIGFWETTVSYGALTFDWTHPRTLATESMRFTAPPSWSPSGPDLWLVSMTVEMLP